MGSPPLSPLRRDVLRRLSVGVRIIDRELTWTERDLVAAGLVQVDEIQLGPWRRLQITPAGLDALAGERHHG